VPLFALIDIETTHGTPSQGGITEVAVLLTDGKQITDQFTTLINPKQPIPRYISGLTGITDDMVADVSFEDIAPKLRKMLEGRIS
jgi:DNA polymerase-3 subunit epsilon